MPVPFANFRKYNEKMLCSVQIIDDYFSQELPLRKVFLCWFAMYEAKMNNLGRLSLVRMWVNFRVPNPFW